MMEVKCAQIRADPRKWWHVSTIMVSIYLPNMNIVPVLVFIQFDKTCPMPYGKNEHNLVIEACIYLAFSFSKSFNVIDLIFHMWITTCQWFVKNIVLKRWIKVGVYIGMTSPKWSEFSYPVNGPELSTVYKRNSRVPIGYKYWLIILKF